MSGLLQDRIAFVTGGGRGIGLAVAERFAREGARVMIGDIDAAAGSAAAERLRAAGGQVEATGVDVTDAASLQTAEAACRASLGPADVVVANAGILALHPVLETSLEEWRRVLDVNLTGVFLTCRTFARAMVNRGAHGRIIISSSLFGRRGGRENGAYSATKFGVIGLAESLAAELAPHGILVNAVCPGQVQTAMMADLIRGRAERTGVSTEAVETDLVARIPMGRMATAIEIADTFVYLASPLARYVTGQSIVVDGGMQVG